MKLSWLPTLSTRTWFALWAIAIVTMLAHAIGHWLGFFAWVEDLNMACIIVFLLLALTPVDASRRVVWMRRCPDYFVGQWVLLNRRTLRQARDAGCWQLVRVELINGVPSTPLPP